MKFWHNIMGHDYFPFLTEDGHDVFLACKTCGKLVPTRRSKTITPLKYDDWLKIIDSQKHGA